MQKGSKPKEISMTNTKKEMLEAYKNLVEELEEKQAAGMKPEEKAAETQKKAAITKADELSSEKIIKDIANLKHGFGALLSDLSEKLEDESARYQTMKKAVEIKEKELNEIY